VIDDDVLHEGEPQPRSALLRREERVEDLPHVRGADSRPRVMQADHDAFPRRAHSDLEPPRGRPRHRLARVADQVDQRLPQLRLVGGDVREPGRDIDGDVDAVLRQLAARHVDDRRDDRADVLAIQLRPRQAREAQVGFGDLRQAVDLADDRRHEPPGLLAAVSDLVAEQLRVQPDRR